MDSFGPNGETLMEYAIYDAIKAWFDHIVCIIRPDFFELFQKRFWEIVWDYVTVDYVFQHSSVTDSLWNTYERTKPWWTGHAILSAEHKLYKPFAVVNADDYYWFDGCQKMANFLQTQVSPNHCGMIWYTLENTLSQWWAVNRWLCTIGSENTLKWVTETFGIIRNGDMSISDINGTILDPLSIVSMNFWWFDISIFSHLNKQFDDFLHNYWNDPKQEFFIPWVVDTLIATWHVTCEVMQSRDSWFGVTYQEDKLLVQEAILTCMRNGQYQEKLRGTTIA
jgi:NDP-sugar pyrophosphorylase family protein